MVRLVAIVVKVFDHDVPTYCVDRLLNTCASQRKDRPRAGEVLGASVDRAAYKLAGMRHQTNVSFKHTVQLPYNEEWFKVPPAAPHGQTPKLACYTRV
jgi:hypothetical protein